MSVFLEIPNSQWVAENEHAFAIRDGYPVSDGHLLVITKVQVPDWFSASQEQRMAIMDLVEKVKLLLDAERHPDGFNVGFNAGTASGQTVMHLHVHVIPRFLGDMDDPSGGVRYAIPTKGNYRRKVRPLAIGGMEDPFAKHIFPLFETASEIAIVAAFVQETGLELIERHVLSAVRRGAAVRILTGDYLDITQAIALETLLDWELGSSRESSEASGSFDARIIETEKLPGLTRAFHPKAWRFEATNYGIAFVGSSNLSRSALMTGIEWNLRVDRDRDGEAYAEVKSAFEKLWAGARKLDAAWVANYAERARRAPHHLPVGEAEAEPLLAPPDPHAVQLEALERLRATRQAGRKRALVVLATGLGKTWLAAFDHQQLCEEMGSLPRVLFLAHRKELLVQAAKTYRRAMRKNGHERATVTWCLGDECDLTGTVVMASVAKLARSLEELKTERFDYVVVDEVHHASANSYRKILNALDEHKTPPRFTLGLTATPQRADSADILALFDDHTAYTAGIDRGVAIKRLVPFHYFGVKDDIDYANIPWRNRRFDPEELAQLAQTEARMQTLWRAWQSHPGSRSLIFCCSIQHALFVRDWLRGRGARANAVFAGSGSDEREDSITLLEKGELDAVCSVDVFNEGVDVPSVDRIVMLRPTESNVIFMQQLGRGLRAIDGKSGVTVIDFVGNHRIFVERLRALFSLAGRADRDVRELIEEAGPVELPSGCSVDLELEAKAILNTLMGRTGADEVEDVYREIRDQRGERPTAVELERMGYPPSRLREKFGDWFGFVHAMGDLSSSQLRITERHSALLHEVEITEMTKSFKMITLQSVVDAHGLRSGLSLDEVARRSHAILRRSPELMSDIENDEHRGDLAGSALRSWRSYWKGNPIKAWLAERSNRRTWFGVKNDVFGLILPPEAEDEQALEEMLIELIELRLAQYRARREVSAATSESFTCKVFWNKRDPILKLPSRTALDLPLGDTSVRVDGSIWVFSFVQMACNVAHRAGARVNQLPDLLRSWFGPSAGRPGTAFEVRFVRSPNGWWCEPVDRKVIELASRRRVVAYPSLQAAAGHGTKGSQDAEPADVILPVEKPDQDLFAIRVAGNSMDGGKAPMRNGDWALMRVSRSSPASALENRVVLVQQGDQYFLKRLRKQGSGWVMASDNPSGPTFAGAEDTTPIARLERVISPDTLAPTIGTVIGETELATAFGLDSVKARTERYDGHLFIFVAAKGDLLSPSRVRAAIEPRPGETAFVLASRANGSFRHCGVGHWVDGDNNWQIPDVDFDTWRRWGAGRSASRELPAGAEARAQLVVDALLQLEEQERWLEQPNGRKARILGSSPRGGLRIDGGEGGFNERTVSITDIAWVVAAFDASRESKGRLDEALVNRSRYLDGTPQESTRYIDTGWALAAWNRGAPLVSTAAGGATPLTRVRNARGKEIDATFRVEPIGDRMSVVVEARGGTKGSGSEVNTEYGSGLMLILERLAKAKLRILDAIVDSDTSSKLSPEKRRLVLRDRTYPVAIDDPAALHTLIGRAQAQVGRAPDAKGNGNSTKRLRLVVDSRSGLSEFLEELAKP